MLARRGGTVFAAGAAAGAAVGAAVGHIVGKASVGGGSGGASGTACGIWWNPVESRGILSGTACGIWSRIGSNELRREVSEILAELRPESEEKRFDLRRDPPYLESAASSAVQS